MTDELPSSTPEPGVPESSPPQTPAPPPEPERVPFWGYGDLLLFFGLAIPSLIVGFALVRGAFTLWGLHFAAPAVEAIASQFTGYLLLFGALSLNFRMQYNRPFWRSLGWKNFRMPNWAVAAGGVLTAIAVVLLATLIGTPNTKNTLTELMADRAGFVLVAVFGITLGPLCEELAFRGFVQPLLVRSLGALPGIIAAAIPFGLLHYQEYGNSWRHAVIVAAAGAAFGWMRHATGSTKASTLMHAAYNTLFFAAFLAQKKEF